MHDFIANHVKRIKPLVKEARLAYWAAATTGKSEDYERYGRLELEIRRIYSNPEEFALLSKQKKEGELQDRTSARQVEVLYNDYLVNQVEPELLKQIVTLGTEVEKRFSIFRGAIQGRTVTDNEIREILKSETDSRIREEAWLAGKQVGNAVAGDIVELVRLRNRAARALGFDNYHSLSLITSEQEAEELNRIFDELYERTNGPFAEVKGELDCILADRYGIEPSCLRPWHYHDPFFQEAPMVYGVDLDACYADHDVKELAARFYGGIDLPVESILRNSDLYEREGKNPHAFCEDMDREGDVRILCNLRNNERWMETTLHELGHAVYDKYHDPYVPYLLREPAHTFTTEAVAIFFGRLSRNAAWMQRMLGLSASGRVEIERASRMYMKLKLLIFARWAMVMYDFEKQLYAGPDQDLSSLWWKLVEKYQLISRPQGRSEPDWASKIHFAVAPCYYHNYMLGELLASQLQHGIVQNVLKLDAEADADFIGRREVGLYFREKIFKVGKMYHWSGMIEQATGEPLTAKYFVGQFGGVEAW